MTIQILGTVNGVVNEGMRNIATHLADAFESEGHKVLYSGLKQFSAIVKNSLCCDVTIVFARLNAQTYWLIRLVQMISPRVWVVCVQKPEESFLKINNRRPIGCNLLTIIDSDVKDIRLKKGCVIKKLPVGMKKDKFVPADSGKAMRLKAKYGFDPNKILVIHVGHCSKGRGLEDFGEIKDAECMVVASGLFGDDKVVSFLNEKGVWIHKGFLPNVEEIYQMADVYLFPTKSTEFVISIPLSVMEALACGTPVVGYKSFENIKAIPCEDNGITLVESSTELSDAVHEASRYKQNKTFLKNALSWDEAGKYVLNIIEGANL